MSVPAITNQFGEFIHRKSLFTERKRYIRVSDGVITGDHVANPEYFVGMSVRGGAKSYPPFPGSSWRPPTAMRRVVARVNHRSPTTFIYPNYLGERYEVTNSGPPDPYSTLVIPGWWGDVYGIIPNSNDIARADTEALVKLGDKKVDYSVALAEAGKTANLLAGTTSQFVRAALAAKRGNFAKAASELGISRRHMRNGRSLAQRHLEWRYGWAPLMKDIHATHGLLKEKLRQPLIIRAERHIKASHSFDFPPEHHGTYGMISRKGTVQRDHSTTLYGRLDDANLRFAQQIGLANPASLAWELIPYSFLVDWAMPIGTMLEALTATDGVSFLAGFRGYHGSLDCQIECKPWDGWSGQPRVIDIKGFAYSRVILNEWPKARPYLKNPFPTGQNVLTLLALMATAKK